MKIKDGLKEAVATSARQMWEKRLTWGRDAGDSSLRDPETGLIYILPKPSSRIDIPNWESPRPTASPWSTSMGST